MTNSWKAAGAVAALLLAAVAATAEPLTRIVLVEEKLASDGSLRNQRREIGQIPGAIRIAVPEGGAHVLVLTQAGKVLAWGDNTYGQLGTGDRKAVEGWLPVEGLEEVTAIAAGAQHSVALRADGTVWTWGSNYQGQLGDGTLVGHFRPKRVEGLTEVVSVAAGAEFTAALKRDGTLWVFGSNWGKVAPDESQRILVRPVEVRGLRLEGELQVRAGKVEVRADSHRAVEMVWRGWTQRERTVRAVGGGMEIAYGDKVERQALRGPLVDASAGWAIGWIEADREAIQAVRSETDQERVESVAVRAVAKGAEPRSAAAFTSSTGGTIAAGDFHSLRLLADGTVWTWGSNDNGQLGDGTTTNRATPGLVSGLTGVISIAGGSGHSLALKSDGTVLAWGYNFFGGLGDGTTTNRPTPTPVSLLTGVIAIAGGGYHSLALKNDGTVWAWGLNNNGQLGNGTTNNSTTPLQVSGLTGVIAIASGANHSLALKSDGTVWAWGNNLYGQLGDGTTNQSTTPVPVGGGLTGVTVIAIAGGSGHSLAEKNDGTVWAWGLNGNGQLGDGSTTNRPAPVQVSLLAGAIAITGGFYHSFAVKNDGTVWAWGNNLYGQLGDGTTTQRTTPVQAFGLTGMIRIAGGGYHSLALKNDGTAWAWGNNFYGQLGDGTTTNRPTPVIVPWGAAGREALRFVPVAPCRVADTRNPAGPFGAPLIAAGSARTFAIPNSACGIPVGAKAYSFNVTVVPQGPLNFLTVWPTGQTRPLISTLNSLDGRIKANAAIVPAGVSGQVSFYATDATNLVLDINGYFVPASGSSNLAFYPVTPCRIADTRLPVGPFGGPSMTAGQTRSFTVPNAGCGIPFTAEAFSLNMTVVPSGLFGFLTTWPAGQARPNVSTLNALTGAITANAAIVPAVNGAIDVYVTDPTEVVIDINGYFAPPGNPGALAFYTVNPCRVSDTRNPPGPLGAPALGAGQTRSFPILSSNCGLPSTAKAYSLNATVVPNGSLGFLSLWPGGQAQPVVSTLNSLDGSVASNAAIVPAGTGGAVNTYVTNSTELILDVNGYFAP